MGEREERALKIAELEGFEESQNMAYKFQYRTHWIKKDDSLIGFETTHDLINFFSSFNGLMPIVEIVNKSEKIWFIIEICATRVKVFDEERFVDHYIYYASVELIDALQQAIINVLENDKDKGDE